MQEQHEERPGGRIPPGLSSTQVEALMRDGKDNQMPKSREGSVSAILCKQIFTLFNGLNLGLALLLFWVGSYRNMLFLGVVVSNTLVGVVQELRAKRMHDKLALLAEGTVQVFRDGTETQVLASRLVLGDIVRLGRGDQVPADGETLEGACETNEALLTGESEPVSKQTGDVLYSGSFITEGSVIARLTAVGKDSYAGRLQMSARKVKPGRSQLMEDMQKIIRRVSLTIVPLGLLLYWRQTGTENIPQEIAVTKTVAAMLGMIPEGLILLTSLALTMGVLRLGKRKALVNALYGIESLARTDVVCMDKTGTLTSGEMLLVETLPLRDVPLSEIQECMAELLSSQKDASPTRDALLKAFPDLKSKGKPLVAVIPFSSQRKWAAAQFEHQTLAMGAPERLLLSGTAQATQAEELAQKGMRVLALCRTDAPICGKALPEGLQPMALLCLRDTLRPEVQDTVAYFEEQGVMLKIISGDNPGTTAQIAALCSIPMAEKSIDLSAVQGSISFDEICESYTVFGRVSPQDKKELIRALQRKGHTVAMVGDGVNDIPALKAADCSIAMGGGSNAAGRVAQITLLEESFALLPEIVLEGRRVIHNITQATSLFLVKNLFSFLLAASLLLLPLVYPFAPIQLTLTSSLTVGIPTFVLALQPSRERVRGNFLRNVFRRALPAGVTIWAATLLLSLLGGYLSLSHEQVSTLSTMAVGYAGLWVLLLTCRPLNALRLLLVMLMAALMVGAVLLLGSVFYLVPLTGAALWVLPVMGVLIPMGIVGMERLLGEKTARSADVERE